MPQQQQYHRVHCHQLLLVWAEQHLNVDGFGAVGGVWLAEVGEGKKRKGRFHHFLRNLISQIWVQPPPQFWIDPSSENCLSSLQTAGSPSISWKIMVMIYHLLIEMMTTTMFVTRKLLGGADCGPGLTLTRLPGSPHYWSAHKNFDWWIFQ